MKIAYRTNRDVDAKQSLSDFLTAPPGYLVQSGKIRQHCGKSGTKTSSCMGWNVCPGSSPTRALHTSKPVFRDLGFDYGNVGHLAAKVIAQNLAGLTLKRLMAGFTCLWKYLFNMIHFFDGNQLSSRAFVTGLPSRIAFSGFLRPLRSWLRFGTIRRRGLGGIGRVSREKSDLTFQFCHTAFENLHGLIRLNDEINRSIGIFIHKLFGFFPCHERRPKLFPISCQENDEKQTRYRASTKTEKTPAPPISPKNGGCPVNGYPWV